MAAEIALKLNLRISKGTDGSYLVEIDLAEAGVSVTRRDTNLATALTDVAMAVAIQLRAFGYETSVTSVKEAIAISLEDSIRTVASLNPAYN